MSTSKCFKAVKPATYLVENGHAVSMSNLDTSKTQLFDGAENDDTMLEGASSKSDSERLSLDYCDPVGVGDRPSPFDDECIDLDLGTYVNTSKQDRRKPPNTYRPSRHFSRYSASLKNFIPLRKSGKNQDTMAMEGAGLFSLLTYGWLTPYMQKSHKQGLKPEDIPLCSTADSCDHSTQRIEYFWTDQVERRGPAKASLGQAVWSFVRTRILLGMVLYATSMTFAFVGPIVFMRRLVEFCQDVDADRTSGIPWAIGMTTAMLAQVLSYGVLWGFLYRTSIRLRSALIGMLYKKIMRLSSLGDKSIGELINLFANDGQRLYDFCTLAPMIVGVPFVAIVGVGYMMYLLGPHALIGVLVFVLFYPVQYCISILTGYFRRRTIVVTDQRIRLINELLTNIKLIKMYAWEKPFATTIERIRTKERSFLEMSAYAQSFSVALTPVAPIIACTVTILVHTAFGYEITPADAFAVFSLFEIMTFPTYALTPLLTGYAECKVALKRIKSVLCMQEINRHNQKPLDRTIAIAISGCDFAYDSTVKKEKKTPDRTPLVAQPSTVLFDIHVLVPKGHLVGICGAVGSGKSSLLSAILGQMQTKNGQVSVDGSFAYVSQQAWIMNCTLQENIVFGEPFDAQKYYKVIHACCLNQDVEMLPAGDQTEIGERGINLSGGQKQRVAMARALYSDKDIYLLDDPLSAVDAHVGHHLFEHCLRGALQGKTVVFVTHQLQYLALCSSVIFMEGGKAVGQGEHADMMQRCRPYAQLYDLQMKEAGNVDAAPEHLGERKASTPPATSIRRENPKGKEESAVGEKDGRLVEEEKLDDGAVPWSTYHTYIKCAGGYVLATLALFTFLLNTSSSAFSHWWLAHWLDAGVVNTSRTMENNTTVEYYMSVLNHPDVHYYELIYGLTILAILLTSCLRSFSFMKVSLRASSVLHNQLFARIFASPMRFFDSTPVGRILNIFSRDLDETDCRLPVHVEAFLQNLLLVLVAMFFISFRLPWFLIALAVLLFLFQMFSRIFRSGLRDLKRAENASRSPIFSHVAATVSGLNTVHAFRKERQFISTFMALYDENSSSLFLFSCSTRWLGVRLDLLTVCVVAVTTGLVVGLHGQIPAAFAALALANTLLLAGTLQFLVRMAGETESRFTSVQRMDTYIKTLESERQDVEPGRGLPESWPKKGSICFHNVKMRYRPNVPLVLKGVSFDIEPREKIGIVGRTGSGKSTLGVCLFRLVEIESGRITIDGLDISEIGLHDLRSKLSIIPQDPVLFIGTVRYNLDPFNQYPDAALWEALERTYMKEKVKALPSQLLSDVVENGENFSVGERQLLCMARALLRHSKIILLDEATAAIDAQTDAMVQKSLSDAFSDCTILTIAHRLNTVINHDRILVLQDGAVVEFDKPSVLLADSRTHFSRLLAASAKV